MELAKSKQKHNQSMSKFNPEQQFDANVSGVFSNSSVTNAQQSQQNQLACQISQRPSSSSSSQMADFKSLFECPICFDYVLPPILQCQNGHLGKEAPIHNYDYT